ncbi:MAG: TIGR00341 family protein [Candidatus Methanosuratincola sp.]|jgi:uncharacterized hydrophobic protein (TIGR00341 family)
MAIRLIEIFLPQEENVEWVKKLLLKQETLGIWHEKVEDNQILIRVLTPLETTETILDLLETHFATLHGFRVVLLPVEASLPRPQEPKKVDRKTAPESPKGDLRISREELYQNISKTSQLSSIYVLLVIMSSIVAAIGILQGSVAVIIGAMVIAPLLGPNVALSLATTLGDVNLAMRAMKTNLVGLAVALSLAFTMGLFLKVDPLAPEVASRTNVGMADVALALASGTAGALSFTMGVPSALIGVMVAVALLPQLVCFGMLLGAGHIESAFGALLLILVNIICVNLSGVTTFLAQGIRPLTWWETERAKRATAIAIALWTMLLAILVAVILVSKRLW